MDKVFIRNFLIFVLLLVTGVGLLIYNLLASDRALGKIDTAVTHTHKVITQAEQLSARVKGMLIAQRTFLLTGDPDFLKEYNAKKTEVYERILTLDELTEENTSQQKRLSELEKDYHAFANKLETRTEQVGPSINISQLGDIAEVDALKDNILLINKSILDEEYELLNMRIRVLQARKSEYLITLIGGILTGTVILLIFNSFLLGAQRKRSRVEASLKDSEDRFALALEGTQDGIFDWDIKSDNVFYSKRFFKMLGYDDKPTYGSLNILKELIHPDDSEKVWKNVELYLDNQLSEYSQEFRLRHKSGRWVWVQSRAKALFDKNNKPYRMVGAHTDITHLKQEQEKLERQKKEAEDANTAKGDFLAHMSHEIRTPLTAISGIAEILDRSKTEFDKKQQKLVNTLNTSAASLKDIINDVLDFSKIESRELELQESVFPLKKLFKDVISMMKIKANEKGINFVFDIKEIDDAEFYGDDVRLRQIIINLIGNALKFTDSGGSITVVAKFEDRDGDTFLRIDVADNGIGIDPGDFDIIFDRFKQADSSESRKYGGTGLGLPISRNLAQLMGGDIFLSSQKGEGSTFSVLLPMKLENENIDEGELKNLNKKLSNKVASEFKDKKKALIVEDYDGNVVVIGYILEEIGLEYDVAENGKEALKFWEENYYSVILMDVQMPEMDGFTATKKIREAEKKSNLHHTPIIGMTAHALVGDKDKCIEAGMDAYLSKPIVEKDLVAEIFKQIKASKKAA